MAKKTKQKRHTTHNAGDDFLTLDSEQLPIVGMFGRSPELKHPREFALIQSIQLYQSATFPTSKHNVVNAIRLRIHKIGPKRFIIKKVDPTQSRIWRVEDGATLHAGGRVVVKRKKTGGRVKGSPFRKEQDSNQ